MSVHFPLDDLAAAGLEVAYWSMRPDLCEVVLWTGDSGYGATLSDAVQEVFESVQTATAADREAEQACLLRISQSLTQTMRQNGSYDRQTDLSNLAKLRHHATSPALRKHIDHLVDELSQVDAPW